MTHNLELEKTLWQAADKLRNNKGRCGIQARGAWTDFPENISQTLLENLFLRMEAEKIKRVQTPKTKDNTPPKGVFSFRHLHVGNGYKAGQNYRPSAKTLMMQWMPLKKTTQLCRALPKDYARPALDKQRLGELIDLITHYFE